MFKKHNRISFLFLAIALILPPGQAAARASQSIGQSLPDYQDVKFVDAETGKSARIDNFGTAGSPGDPDLPSASIVVILPPSADERTVSIKMVDARTETKKLDFEIAPAPPLVNIEDRTEEWGRNKVIVDGRNTNVYGQDRFYPESHVRVDSIGKMRRYKLLKITYYPVQYNPVTKEIAQAKGGRIEISFSINARPESRFERLSSRIKDKDKKRLFERREKRILKRFVKRLSANFDAASAWYESSGGNGASDTLSGGISAASAGADGAAVEGTAPEATGTSGDPEPAILSDNTGYLILTTNQIVNNSLKLADFVAHKTSLGFNVSVAAETEWGGGTGNTAANNIRQYLQDHYLDDGIEYVLLIGNPNPATGNVPMKMLWPRYTATTNTSYRDAPSDYYYADLTGNWDLNGNGYYGEAFYDAGPGGIDMFPEVIVGRIPNYGSITDLDSILTKLINYESGNFNGPWTRKVLLSMKPADSITPGYNLGEAIKDDIISQTPDFTSVRVYDSDFGLIPPPDHTPTTYTNVLDAWMQNAGAHVWFTHGSDVLAVEVWRTAYNQYLADNYPSFVFSVSCDNGKPETTNNISYNLLKQGAIGTITSSRVNWYYPAETDFDSPSDAGMAYRYMSKLILDFQPFGDALFNVNTEKGYLANIDGELWMNVLVFNLYGDPSMVYSEPRPRVEITSPADGSSGGQDDVVLQYKINRGGEVRIFDNSVLVLQEDLDTGTNQYLFSVLDAGEHALRVELASAIGDASDEIHYTAMAPYPTAIEGHVTHGRNQTPVPDVNIRVQDAASGSLLETVMTDQAGHYLTSVLAPGQYRVSPYDPQGAYLFSPEEGFATIAYAPIPPIDFTANVPPVLNYIGPQSVNEGQTLSLVVSGSDPDGDSLAYSVSGLPPGAAFDAETRAFTWTPTYSEAGTYEVTFTVSDGNLSDSETVQITVNNINQSPVLNGIGPQSVNEGQTLSLVVSGSDPDIDSVIYTASGLPAGAVFDAGTRTFTWTPTYSEAGTYEVTFTVSDGSLSDSETVPITVNNINQAPVLNGIGPQSVNEGQTLSLAVSGSDPDGDSLAYSVSGLPPGAAFDAETRAFTWTPTYSEAGTYEVTFTLSDGNLSDSEAVQITVNNINQAPVLNGIGPQNVNEGQTLSLVVSGSDPDIDNVIYTASGLPAGAVFDTGTRTFTWTPTYSEAGTYEVTFTVSDGTLSDSETVQITVNNINQSPVLNGIGPQSVNEGQTLSLVVSASDPDIDSVIYSAGGLPAGAVFDAGTRTFTWTPTYSEAGAYEVTFTVSDGSLSDSETVQITVNNINQAPVLNGIGPQNVNEGQTLSLVISASDPDADSVIYSASGLPAGAVFDAGTRTFTWTPTYSEAGTYDVTFTVSDGSLSDFETVRIVVNNVPGEDMVMTAVSAPASGMTGAAVTISSTVQNKGPDQGSYFYVGLYLSADPIITTADTYIGRRLVKVLNPQATSSGNTTITVPANLTPGTYYIGAVADHSNVRVEQDENNNTLAGNQIVITPGEDMVMAAVNGPASGMTGAPITISNTAKNQGASQGSYFYVGLYLSADPIITTADTYIGRRLVKVLNPQASSPADTTVTLPSSLAPGTYYIGAVADHSNVRVEQDENNNSLAGNQIVITPGEDMVMAAVNGPASGMTGAPITISNTAKNQGASQGSYFYVGLYLSTDQTITTADTYLGRRLVGVLNPQTTSSSSTTITLPLTLATGTYYIGAIADYSNVRVEQDENNNSLAGNQIVIRSGEDIVMTAVSAPVSGMTGAPINISSTAQNIGPGQGGYFYVGLYLSTDPTITTADTYLGRSLVGVLNPQAASSANTIITLPANLAPGTYYIGAIADYPNAKEELDENNNSLTGNQIVITPGADLVVDAVSGPANGIRGSAISITDTVRNQGDGNCGSFHVGYYLSTDMETTTSDRYIGRRKVNSLNVGQANSATTSVVLPSDIPAGTYYLGTIVDYLDASPEQNDSNNALAGNQITVQ